MAKRNRDLKDSASTESYESDTKPVTAASRYQELEQDRLPFLRRAREAAELTIPSLMPPEGATGATTLYQPYQSTGADGLNNLSAKLLLVMFPPGNPFFRFTVNDFVMDKLTAGKPPGSENDPRADIESAFGKLERAVVNRMEQKGARPINFEAIQHLILGGNALIHVEKDGAEKFHPLSRYVVSRDLAGSVLEIIVKETIAKEALPKELRDAVEQHTRPEQGKTGKQEVEVYTWVQRQEDESWKVCQEVCGELVDSTRGTYPKGKCAWIPLRWTRLSGENYGRGRCEEYIGDLRSLESATKSIVQFGAAVSKLLFLVSEGGTTSKEAIARAKSGDVLDGNAKDVTVLMVEKGQDFNVLKSIADETKGRLERAFLQATSIQRNAERVTAEEIRVMAGELEQGLGGVYSILSEEYQRPLVTLLMHVMGSSLPKLPEGIVSPQIVAGLDGLGRNTDMLRLDTLIQGTGTAFGQEALAKYINVGTYVARRGAALGIDMKGLVRSDQEIQAAEQQASMKELTGKLGGPAINAISQQAIANKQQGAPQQAPAQQ